MGKTSNLVKGGVFTAATVILLYLSTILPTNRISLITLAGCMIPLAIITTKVRTAFLVYVSSSLLGIILGLRGSAILYIIFFGSYALIKLYIEKLRNIPMEYAFKLICFNISLLLTYGLYKLFSLVIPTTKFMVWVVIVVVEIAFLIYDYVLTIFIMNVNNRINKGSHT